MDVPIIVDDEIVAAERVFVDANPFESVLRRAAQLANIDSGRIDYGLVDGHPQGNGVTRTYGTPYSLNA